MTSATFGYGRLFYKFCWPVVFSYMPFMYVFYSELFPRVMLVTITRGDAGFMLVNA